MVTSTSTHYTVKKPSAQTNQRQTRNMEAKRCKQQEDVEQSSNLPAMLSQKEEVDHIRPTVWRTYQMIMPTKQRKQIPNKYVNTQTSKQQALSELECNRQRKTTKRCSVSNQQHTTTTTISPSMSHKGPSGFEQIMKCTIRIKRKIQNHIWWTHELESFFDTHSGSVCTNPQAPYLLLYNKY